MELIKIEKGRGAGKISILRTLRTFEPGECHIFEVGQIDPFNARAECAKEFIRTGARYSVSANRGLGGRVVICRHADNR